MLSLLFACSGLSFFGSGPEGASLDARADQSNCEAGSFCNPHVARMFPFTHSGDTRNAPQDLLDAYSCAPDTDESGGEYVYRVDVTRGGTLSIDVSDGSGVDVDIHILSAPDADACEARGHISVDEEVVAGSYWVVVDTWVSSSGQPAAGEFTVNIDFEPDPHWGPSPWSTWSYDLSSSPSGSEEVHVVALGADHSELQGKRICSFPGGHDGSWYVDTRSYEWLDRLELSFEEAAERGCDAVLPRDVDGFNYRADLERDDSLAFARWLASQAHVRGMSIALDDATDLAADLVDDFEMVVAENCLVDGDCGALQPFVDARKAVLHAELFGDVGAAEAARDDVCDAPQRRRFSSLVATDDRSGWQIACPRSDLYSALQAITQDCERLEGTSMFRSDRGSSYDIPICELDGAIWWTSDFDIDCDGGTESSCTSDPWYQSSTATTDSAGNYLDANELPFVVVPIPSGGFDYRDHDLRMGSVVAVLYNGHLQFGVIGDAGPRNVVGEGSYAMAEALGIDPHPVSGGVGGEVTFIHFQGLDARVQPIEDQLRAFDLGTEQAWDLVSDN